MTSRDGGEAGHLSGAVDAVGITASATGKSPENKSIRL